VPPEAAPEVLTVADDPSIEWGTLTASNLNQLLDRLHLEPDETGAVSIAARVDEAAADIVYASILFGPPEMSIDSWPDWAARTSPAAARLLAQMTSLGLDLGTRWREFDLVLDGWLFARWTIGSDDADRAAIATWIADLLAGNEVPAGTNGNLRISASARGYSDHFDVTIEGLGETAGAGQDGSPSTDELAGGGKGFFERFAELILPERVSQDRVNARRSASCLLGLISPDQRCEAGNGGVKAGHGGVDDLRDRAHSVDEPGHLAAEGERGFEVAVEIEVEQLVDPHGLAHAHHRLFLQ
jgi:hypothetical protein